MIDDALLDSMRQSGDPLADAVIGDFLGAGEIPELNALLGRLHADMARPAGFPPRLAAYLEESAHLPAWADPVRIERAQRLFSLHGPLFGLVMLFKSLPILYAGGKGGAQVLEMTGQLHKHYRRRASETLRFILDVMEPGGLGTRGPAKPSPGQAPAVAVTPVDPIAPVPHVPHVPQIAPIPKGIRTAQKVRLMHAAIRAYASSAPGWKGRLPAWGRPINQEELGGTLLAFSTVTLDGVKAMGLTLSRKDAEAYFHTWRVIGHVLGIDPRLLPENIVQSRPFWKSLVRRNFCRTDEGLMLIRDHQEFLADLIPGKILDRGIPTLLRYLMGRNISDTVLDLPKSSKPDALLLILLEFFHLQRIGFLIFPRLVHWARGISIHLMESFQAYLQGGHSKPFNIPPSLTQH